MKVLVVFALLLVVAGCAPSLYQQGLRSLDEGQLSEAERLFYQELEEHPDSHRAWRELGVAFYRAGDLSKARSALEEADRINTDARTKLYLGLIHEKAADYDGALAAYRAALDLNPRGDTRQKVRAHLEHLVKLQIQQEIAAAMAVENDLAVESLPDNTICVANFDLPDSLAFLRSGLVEFTAIDLGKVTSLRVVERRKISELLKELELQHSDLVDPSTQVRVGKLVGSRNVVTGSLQLFDDRNIELFGAAHDVVDDKTSFTDPASGDLEGFFRVQKAFVFRLIDSLGIELTPEERSSIEEVPTENYLALMAYCRGLDYLDAGNYEQAADQFGAAAAQDKSFSEAQVQADMAADIVAVSSDFDVGSVQLIEAAASNLDLTAADQEFLSALIDNAGFLPADLLNGYLQGELANLPDTGSVTAVSVTVRGEIHVDQ